MRSQFSEFTYGFTLTHELVNASGGSLRAAPEFPSLLDEGKSGGGYDVKLTFGRPLLLQFKLSEYMKGTNSKESEQSCFGLPYYRFDLRPLSESNQHNLLLDWEARGEQVYYAAPAFHKASEINRHFLASGVERESVFVKPSVIGQLPDRKKHRIIFVRGVSYGYLCSEPKRIPMLQSGETLLGEVLEPSPARSEPIDESFFRQVGDKIASIASERGNIPLDEIEGRLIELTPADRAVQLARVLFDAELMLIIDQREEVR